jgi:hypothetical protein
MQGEDVKACTTLMALHGQRAGFVLHRKVISDGAGSIANKVECRREPFFRKEITEEIVEGVLSKRIHSGLLYALNHRTNLENGRRTQVRGQRLVAGGTFVHFDCSIMIDTLRSGDLQNMSAYILCGAQRHDVQLPS